MKLMKIFTICMLAIISICAIVCYNEITLKKEFKETIIEIPKGSGTKAIASILKENDMIVSSIIFVAESQKKGYAEDFKYGKFKVNNKMTSEELMETLTSSGEKVEGIKFVIPEGYTIKQIGEKLEDENIISKDSFYAAAGEAYDYEFLKDLEVTENYLEGYLFPSTYELAKDSTAEDIIIKLLNGFNDNYDPLDVKKAEALGYTYHDVITVASIIEREVKVPLERKKVAGVIYNRLRDGIKLQMCSTIQYILGEPKARLFEKDLEIESDYNTYMNAGLPIGPISSPGLDAIEAALNPEKHNYYFFVVKDSKTGTHQFSETLSEHNVAKADYINDNF